MTSSPLVSVIVPAYNAAAFIRQMLASALAQTYANFELIVVDDGSQDNTGNIVQTFVEKDERVILLHQANAGVAAARNLAIERSKGEFIAPLDADDLWHPQKLEKQVQCMLDAPASAGLVYTWWVGVDEKGLLNGSVGKQRLEGEVLEALVYTNFLGCASTPLFRRSCTEQLGGYQSQLNEGGQGCEDWDLALRIAGRYRFRVVPSYLVAYRSVRRSMSQAYDKMEKSYDLTMAGVRQRRPDIPPRIFRWSRSNFYLYLARLSYKGGNYRAALSYLHKTLRLDSAAGLAPQVGGTAVLSLLKLAAARNALPERRDADDRAEAQYGGGSFLDFDEAAVTSALDKQNWRRYNLYNGFRKRRWRQILQELSQS